MTIDLHHAPLWRADIDPTQDGPHTVRIDKGEWHDHARGRFVPWKLYRPEHWGDKKLPVVIWSHGLGGTRDGAGFLGRHMASFGYVHLHVQHDGTDDALWRNARVHPWDAIRAAMPLSWSVVRNRYLDIPFVLDQISQMEWPVDTRRIGLCGHSFGALTTQVLSGMLAGPKDHPEHLSDPRFVAGILYSPVPNQSLEMDDAQIYGGINRPLLHMTGTKDDSPLDGFGYQSRLPVFEYATNAAQHLAIINGADHMVFNGSRGQLPSYPDIDLHQAVIRTLSHAWWDAFLGGDENAAKWIADGAIQNWFSRFGAYKSR